MWSLRLRYNEFYRDKIEIPEFTELIDWLLFLENY